MALSTHFHVSEPSAMACGAKGVWPVACDRGTESWYRALTRSAAQIRQRFGVPDQATEERMVRAFRAALRPRKPAGRKPDETTARAAVMWTAGDDAVTPPLAARSATPASGRDGSKTGDRGARRCGGTSDHSSGPGTSSTRLGFLPGEIWTKDPKQARVLWDAAIAAAAAVLNDAPSTFRLPRYLELYDECVTKSLTTQSVELERHYKLRDQWGMALPGGRFVEFNAVVAGTPTSTNTSFRGDDWDFVFSGNQDVFNFYQTFVGYNDKGYGPTPIFVMENGVPYGVLAVETTRHSIVINGVDKSRIRSCGDRDPWPL